MDVVPAKFQLRVKGNAELDATHRAIIETNLPSFETIQIGSGNKPKFLRINKGGKTCGVILSEIRYGTANEIGLDRFKQRHLNVKDGELVDIEEINPANAAKIELYVPSDFSERDTVRFIGKPVSRNEKTAVYAFSGDPNSARIVVINNVAPKGIVLIVPTTEFANSIIQSETVPITYKDIGGLSREIKSIREVVEYPFRFPDVFEYLGYPSQRE